jgi:hypothetical protein
MIVPRPSGTAPPRLGPSWTRIVPLVAAEATWSGVSLVARIGVAVALGVLVDAVALGAQAVTTAAVEVRVKGAAGDDMEGTRIRVVNRATGYAVEAPARAGRASVRGLDVGGPYSVLVRRPGYIPQEHSRLFLALGQPLRLEVTLLRQASALDAVRVVAHAAGEISHAGGGIGATISDSSLHRLPTIDRDLYDFVQLTPQVSTRSGVSGGGVSIRFNSFLLDGVSDRGVLGNLPAGTGQGAKSVSIEAVREYQVLLSPYDSRYGDFAGALVNAVTRGGTNEVHGTAFVHTRNEGLARGTPFLRDSPYERTQFGFAVGGPIVRDRVHFFLAPELQRLTAPARGPYFGQGAASETPLPVSPADVTRFADILGAYGLSPGSAGVVKVGNPLANLFARIDVAVPEWGSRLVVSDNYARAENIVFARGTSTGFLTRGVSAFPLSSQARTVVVQKNVAAAQLYTNFAAGGLNELLVARKTQPSRTAPNERAPSIAVAVPRADSAGTVLLEAGSHEAAHGIAVRARSVEIADHVTMPVGAAHCVTFGARVESFAVESEGLPGTYGSWLFGSLDSLERGEAERFRLVERAASIVTRRGLQYGAYVGDEWRPGDRFTLTLGVRVDAVTLRDAPPVSAVVDSIFGPRASGTPAGRLHWSPRLGVQWDVAGDGRSQLRGGVGIFAGRVPAGWLHSQIGGNGSGSTAFQCGPRPTDAGPAPRFVPDHRHPPAACADGSRTGGGGLVTLANWEARLAETLRGSLAYDRRLAWGVTATLEALYTRNLTDVVFVNLNLAGPQGMDRDGRVMYGHVDPSGAATPALVTDRFSDVLEIQRHSRNSSFQLAAQLQKQFSAGLEARAAYAYSRVRDVQTPPSEFAYAENWRLGRVVSGRHDALTLSVSALEIPHRVVLAGTYALPWRRWTTDVSLYYVGESGSPYAYVAWGTQRRGDLNADGANVNDPIYVPHSASDTTEIRFSGVPADVAAQQAGFERLIADTPCLRRQRGRIMARNSCRAPWVHVANLSVRQALPPVRGHKLALQVDVFNVLNLLNEDWGRLRVVSPGPNVALLEQIARTPGPLSASQPVFRFDASRARFDDQNVDSAYQLQLGVRYSF